MKTANLKGATAEAARFAQETLRHIPRIVISAEERLRQKVRSTLRLIVAAMFFLLSNVVTLGINVSMALAKKTGTEQSREKRQKGQQKAKLRFKQFTHLNRDAEQSKQSSTRTVSKQTGKASWYGKQFHNRRTASGKRFNTYAMMAAHRTLPFGTKVRVTNLSNKKSCIVEIADRGPYIGNRIIDLSYAAANELDFASKGIANVQIDIIDQSELFNYASMDGDIISPRRAKVEEAVIPQPMPEFDAMPRFPTRLMLQLRGIQPEVAFSESES